MATRFPGAFAVAAIAGAAHAGISLTRITDTSATMPGTSYKFLDFDTPAMDSGRVVFHARALKAPQVHYSGVFHHSGSSLVAMEAPSLNLDYGLHPSVSGGVATYWHGYFPTSNWALRAWSGSSPSSIVTNATLNPDGFGAFDSVSDPTNAGGTIAFVGASQNATGSVKGVYAATSLAVVSVANTSTPIPGGTGNFQNFYNPSIRLSKVEFVGTGSGNQRGIYRRNGTSLSVTADTSTPVPGKSATFSFFAYHSFAGAASVFTANSSASSKYGVFRHNGVSIGTVADTSTVLPTWNAAPVSFASVAAGADNTAFIAQNAAGQVGLFARYEPYGGIASVLLAGDALDGRTVKYITIGSAAVDGQQIALQVSFTNGTSGVYKGTLPRTRLPSGGDRGPFEPVTFDGWQTISLPAPGSCALALAGVGLMLRRRRA